MAMTNDEVKAVLKTLKVATGELGPKRDPDGSKVKVAKKIDGVDVLVDGPDTEVLYADLAADFESHLIGKTNAVCVYRALAEASKK